MGDFPAPNPERSRFEVYGEGIRGFLIAEKGKSEKISTLYDHQIEAVFEVEEYLRNNEDHPALIVAPTGAGKSGIIALLPYVLESKKVLILSPSKKITDQLELEFGLKNNIVKTSFLYKQGVVKEEDLNRMLEKGCVIRNTLEPANMQWDNLVIANAQKFSSNTRARLDMPDRPESGDEAEEKEHEEIMERIREIKKNFKAFSTLIVDEAHHYPAKTWDLIVQEFKKEQVVFLTATPYRGREGKPLREGQKITYQITIPKLIELNILRPLEFSNVEVQGLSAARERRSQQLSPGHYKILAEEILRKLKDHDELVPGVKHKAMVLVATIRETTDGARAMGDMATYYTSEKGSESNLKAFANGHKKILFVCGRLLEGYDNNTVSVCVILRRVGTIGTFTQFVGRCVRTTAKDGTDQVKAVVLSHEKFEQAERFDQYRTMNRILDL